MHVAFVEPSFPKGQREHVRALKQVGARVTGIGAAPRERLDAELAGWLDGYEQVRSVVDETALEGAVRRAQGLGPIDRLEATIDAHELPVARVRERCGIAGTSVRTAVLCRDAAAMQQVLREAGIPCARSTGASDARTVREFAVEVGYPIVVKPLDGSGTFKACNDADLADVVRDSGVEAGRPVVVEEFLESHEGFYDTLCHAGRIVHDFVCDAHPNVLEALHTRWISPRIVATNRVDQPAYRELRAIGQRVIEVLGIETSATHMGWFSGPRGLRVSGIGCRPGGWWDLYGAGNELDPWVEWARLIVDGRTDAKPTRRYAVGLVALRPDRDGRIRSYEGLDTVERRHGESILEAHFPPPGTPTQPVAAGYRANAWVVLRHPDEDHLRAMLDDVGRTVRVVAD